MMAQAHREQAMFSFKHHHVSVLVATMKLCGRGVNVDGIHNLVFWEIPDTLDSKFPSNDLERFEQQRHAVSF